MALPLPDNLFLYEVEEKGTLRSFVSPVPTDHSFKQGLPPVAIIGEFLGGVGKSGPERVVLNPEFLAFVHEVLIKHGPASPGIDDAAEQLGTGSLSIIDQRTPDPHGAVPSEDVIGAFEVAEGRLGAYRANPNYQMVNQFGFIRLPDWYHKKLIGELTSL